MADAASARLAAMPKPVGGQQVQAVLGVGQRKLEAVHQRTLDEVHPNAVVLAGSGVV
mgnify:CR=1 FL=1